MLPCMEESADSGQSADVTVTGDLISRIELAKEFDVSQHTLRKWELRGRGPPTIRVGRRIFYRAQAVRQWLLEQEASAATG